MHAVSAEPRPLAWMNGRIVPASEATVPLLDDGFLRGDAVFDVALVRGGRTHALDDHLARLRRSAKALGIRVPVLRQVVTDLLAAWGDRDGSLRLVVTRDGIVRGVLQAATWPSTMALQPVDMPWRTALTGVKTLSYAANVWATRQAKAAQADDAIVVNGDIVLESPTAAIAWVKDEVLRAPDPDALPILDSITLAHLGRLVDVELGVHTLDELLDADEVFLLSATRPVMPVHAIDETTYPAPGPVTSEVHETFERHIDETLDPRP